MIVEDETAAAKNLKSILQSVTPEAEVLDVIDTVVDSVEWFENNEAPDLVFMDIHLSDGESFKIFEKVKVLSPVVFTTAYDQYALKAFQVSGIDYLLKPIDASSLKRAVARCRMSGGQVDVEALMKAIGGNAAPKKEYKERFIIRFNDRIVPVPTAEIAYVYSEEKTNYLITFKGDKYIIDTSLDVMVEELDPEKFFRISRGCIVSMNAISSIIKQAGSRLKIVSKPDAPFEMTVSRSRVDDFLSWLER